MSDNQVDHPADITDTSRHTQREIMVRSAVRVVSKQTRDESPQRRVLETASISERPIATSTNTRSAWPIQSSQPFYVGPRFICNLMVAVACM